MKKLKQTESQFLNRTEVVYEVDHFQKPSPKNDDVRKSLASELKVDESLIDLKHVYSNFGSSKSKIIADIYKNKEDMQRFVKLKKQKEVKSDEAPQQEVKTEAKKEA